MENANAQLHVYEDGRVHVQVGEMGNYKKFDVSDDSEGVGELRTFYRNQVEYGNYNRSFANTDTPYVPVEVKSRTAYTVRASVPAYEIEVEA